MIHPTFGAKLTWIREIRGLKQADLAKAAGFQERIVYAWENGERNISYSAALRLARALGVHVSFLLDHTPPPEPQTRSIHR